MAIPTRWTGNSHDITPFHYNAGRNTVSQKFTREKPETRIGVASMATVRQRCQGAFLRVCGPRSVVRSMHELRRQCGLRPQREYHFLCATHDDNES